MLMSLSIYIYICIYIYIYSPWAPASRLALWFAERAQGEQVVKRLLLFSGMLRGGLK